VGSSKAQVAVWVINRGLSGGRGGEGMTYDVVACTWHVGDCGHFFPMGS